MSAIIQGSQLRTLDSGLLVTRPASNLPQTGTTNIYTVTGGRILLTGLVGLVTTVFGATVTNLKVRSIPTTGTAGDIAANVLVTNKEVGTLLALNTTVGGALVSTSSYGAIGMAATPLIIPVGSLAMVTDASNTGQIQWDLTWIPFDDGASVVAA